MPVRGELAIEDNRKMCHICNTPHTHTHKQWLSTMCASLIMSHSHPHNTLGRVPNLTHTQNRACMSLKCILKTQEQQHTHITCTLYQKVPGSEIYTSNEQMYIVQYCTVNTSIATDICNPELQSNHSMTNHEVGIPIMTRPSL